MVAAQTETHGLAHTKRRPVHLQYTNPDTLMFAQPCLCSMLAAPHAQDSTAPTSSAGSTSKGDQPPRPLARQCC
jgi:hypothetical protein